MKVKSPPHNYSVLLHIILTFAYCCRGDNWRLTVRKLFITIRPWPAANSVSNDENSEIFWWSPGPFFLFEQVLSIGFWHNLNRFLNLNYQPNYDELDSLMTNGFTYLLIPSLKYFHSIMLVWLVGSGWVWLGRARIIFNNDQTIIDLLHSQVCVEPHTKLC